MKNKITMAVALLMACMMFSLVGVVFAVHQNYYCWDYTGEVIGDWDSWHPDILPPYGHGFYESYVWQNYYVLDNPINAGHWSLPIRFGQYLGESLQIHPNGKFKIYAYMLDDSSNKVGFGIEVVTNPNNDNAIVYFVDILTGQRMYPEEEWTVNLNDYNVMLYYKSRIDPSVGLHNWIHAVRLATERKSDGQITTLDYFSGGYGGVYSMQADSIVYGYSIYADYGSTGFNKRFMCQIPEWDVGYYNDVSMSNGKIDIYDVVLMGVPFGNQYPDNTNWMDWWFNTPSWKCDITANFKVDIYDLVLVTGAYGTEWT